MINRLKRVLISFVPERMRPQLLSYWRKIRKNALSPYLCYIQHRIDVNVRNLRTQSPRMLRVAFLVLDDMVFQLEHVFQLMLKDHAFEVSIVMIPDLLRGSENAKYKMEKGLRILGNKYPNSVISSIGATGAYIDIKDRFDLFFVMNPYAKMTHKYYTFKYLAVNAKPVVYANYAVGEGTINAANFNSLLDMSYLWRYYLERPSEEIRVSKNHPMLVKFGRINIVGAAKSDLMASVVHKDSPRKKIILAPHHSVPGNNTPLSIGNFDIYAGLFLRLPVLFPQIDWVFRPHPMLFWTMKRVGYWTERVCDAYMAKMRSYKNVEVQDYGDYYEAFVNSDAIIQDSGSFLAEYHISGHPQCYILRDKFVEQTQFNEFGRRMLEYTYKAYSENDIIRFITDVVINGHDTLKDDRELFVKEELTYNYPYASESIVNDIKKVFGVK